MTGRETGRERRENTGHGLIRHTLEFTKHIREHEVWRWIEENNFLGYHPAGYGPGKLESLGGHEETDS